MYPILFTIGDAALQTYTIAISLAFFMGLGIWYQQTRPCKISGEKIINLSIFAFLVGLLGARLLFVLTQLPKVIDGSLRIEEIWKGGVVFYGGALSAIAYLYWALPRAKVSRLAGFNTAAPAIAFAHAVGRIGCFFNGCCFGDICHLPWAVTYTNPLATARPLNTPLHPSQLYEVLGLIVLGFCLIRANRRKKSQIRWQSYQIYLIGYGIMRFFIEFTRADPMRGGLLNLSTSQWISLGMIASAILLDFTRHRGHNFRHENRS